MRAYKPNNRTYHRIGHYVVISTDDRERRRLKTRGVEKILVQFMDPKFYRAVRNLTTGTYEVIRRDNGEFGSVKLDVDLSRTPVRR